MAPTSVLASRSKKEVEMIGTAAPIKSVAERSPKHIPFFGRTSRVRGMSNYKVAGAELGVNSNNEEPNSLCDDCDVFFAKALLEIAITKYGVSRFSQHSTL